MLPVQHRNAFPSFSSLLRFLAVKSPPGIGGPRCQQQREPPIYGYGAVPIGRIILGEGVQIQYEQEYRNEFFHVDREVLKPRRALFMDKLKCLDWRSGLTKSDQIFTRRKETPFQDPVLTVHRTMLQ